ncbi:MAG: OsmC family protein [Candidatus Nanohaloarchaea archaeon]
MEKTGFMTGDSELKFSVEAEGKTATKTEVSVRGFEFTIDEPEDIGGENAAPNPVEYLLGALSGCINATVHQVASERDIEVEALEVEVSGELNPAKFYGKSDEPRAGYKSVEAELELETDSPEQEKELLEEVKTRCPVSDNISHKTPLNFNL